MPDLARGTPTDEVSDIGHLVELVTARPAWHADAACREHPEVDFFVERGTPSDSIEAVCAGCLVRPDCLAWAIDQGPSLDGWWGGTSPRERRRLLRHRPSESNAGGIATGPPANGPVGNRLPVGPCRNAAQLADHLGVGVTTVHRWHRQGVGPPAVWQRGRLLFPAADTAAWSADRQRTPGGHRPNGDRVPS